MKRYWTWRTVWMYFVALAVMPGANNALVAEEFSIATSQYSWSFPRDHGAHPQYKTEWWYYTGQLYEAGNEPFVDAPRYGFQLTFFRRGEFGSTKRVSEYMAHAALTDLATGKTYFSQRLGGGGIGIAGAAGDSLAAYSGDWSVDPLAGRVVLRFSLLDGESIMVRLLTETLPPVWLQGKNGFSQKAGCDGCGSMYYSIPRISVVGSIAKGEVAHTNLHGIAWMDHEFMSNSLAKNHVGWDWLGLMLKDGRSLVVFQLRDRAGRVDFASAGIWNGTEAKRLSASEFTMTPRTYWKSGASGARYPVSWRIEIPSEGIDTVVSARVEGCEVGGAMKDTKDSKDSKEVLRYWEGPVASGNESVVGYLEMTGYAGAVMPF